MLDIKIKKGATKVSFGYKTGLVLIETREGGQKKYTLLDVENLQIKETDQEALVKLAQDQEIPIFVVTETPAEKVKQIFDGLWDRELSKVEMIR